MVLKSNYSADVGLHLVVGEDVYQLSKMGPGYVVPRDPIELSACDAELVMTVNGREYRWEVSLRDDVVPFDEVVLIHSRV